MPKSTSFLIINCSSKYNDSKFETPCQKREHKVSKKKKEHKSLRSNQNATSVKQQIVNLQHSSNLIQKFKLF